MERSAIGMPRSKLMSAMKTNERRIDNYGYIAEVAIPRSKLTITSGQVLVNFSITKRNSVDAICDVASTSTARWIPVTGL